MPNSTLTAMTSASALTGTELFYSVQGGADRKVTSSQFYTYVTSVSTLGTALGPFTANQLVYASSSTTVDGIAGSVWSSSVSTLSLQTNTLTFASTAGAAEMMIDNLGSVFINSSASYGAFSIRAGLQSASTSNLWNVSAARFSNDTGGGGWQILKSRGATVGANVAVHQNDSLGNFYWVGADGAGGYQNSVVMEAFVDGGAGSAASMPGRLTISTVPVGSVTAAERVRIDNLGNLIIYGGPGVPGDPFIGANGARLQVHGTDLTTAAQTFTRWSNNNGAPKFYMGKSRGATIGTHVILQVNDNMGDIYFNGSDGITFQETATIRGTVDATPVGGNVPARLSIHTCPTAGGGGVVERFRVDSAGNSWLMSVTGVSTATPTGATASVNGIAANFAHASYGGI